MIITAKIKFIEKSVKDGWNTIVLTKQRRGKPIEIPVFFGSNFNKDIADYKLYIGLRIDVVFFYVR